MRDTLELRDGRPLTLAVHGTFDASAVRRVVEAVTRTPRGHSIVLDFTHTREVHHFAMAGLAQALPAQGGPHIETRGLTEHQRGVLRHLHIDPSTLALLPSA